MKNAANVLMDLRQKLESGDPPQDPHGRRSNDSGN
jgi:hypothetical protein